MRQLLPATRRNRHHHVADPPRDGDPFAAHLGDSDQFPAAGGIFHGHLVRLLPRQPGTLRRQGVAGIATSTGGDAAQVVAVQLDGPPKVEAIPPCLRDDSTVREIRDRPLRNAEEVGQVHGRYLGVEDRRAGLLRGRNLEWELRLRLLGLLLARLRRKTGADTEMLGRLAHGMSFIQEDDNLLPKL